MRETQPKHSLPSYEDALREVLGHVTRGDEELVPLGGALGRVSVRGIVADRDQPPFDRSAMDGYALDSNKFVAGESHLIVGTVAAGSAVDDSINFGGGVVRIATGAALPAAYDAVIPVEQADEDSDGKYVRFRVDHIEAGACVHGRASDAVAGQTLIPAGTLLGPRHVGLAAAVGVVEVPVTEKPSVSLITAGDEVRPPAIATDALEPQQIRNSNGPMVDALLRALGVELMDHVHVVDDPQATRSAAEEALGKSDLVITVGGVSAGRRDYLPGVWDALGLKTLVKGVAIQPGKPVLVVKSISDGGKLVIGLPGNPVSVLATAHLFVWPIVRAMVGLPAVLPWRVVRLANEAKPNPRREVFRSARLVGAMRDSAEVIHWHGSGDLAHTSQAEGFIRLPIQAEPLSAGASVAFLPMIGGTL